MRFHREMPFSTYDRDNDFASGRSCAIRHQGGWWYNDCFACNINGVYGESWDIGLCLVHRIEQTHHCNVTHTEMKMRPLETDNSFWVYVFVLRYFMLILRKNVTLFKHAFICNHSERSRRTVSLTSLTNCFFNNVLTMVCSYTSLC